MKFIMRINVEMPTIVGILTFISKINESFKAGKILICSNLDFSTFETSWIVDFSMIKVYRFGAGHI